MMGQGGMPKFRVWLTMIAISLVAMGITWLRDRDAIPATFQPQFLPDREKKLIEFLILLPLAALTCSAFRNVIGIQTFGTFAPALLALAFRDVASPLGIFVLLVVLSIGWMFRKAIAKLNLLQVPRAAAMLTIIIAMLILFVLVANHMNRHIADALPFLPLVIVTGLIERFWLMEEEDGTAASLRVMIQTFVAAIATFAIIRFDFVRDRFMSKPETLLYILAMQILLGRYTGYRISELYRFRELAKKPTVFAQRVAIPQRRF